MGRFRGWVGAVVVLGCSTPSTVYVRDAGGEDRGQSDTGEVVDAPRGDVGVDAAIDAVDDRVMGVDVAVDSASPSADVPQDIGADAGGVADVPAVADVVDVPPGADVADVPLTVDVVDVPMVTDIGPTCPTGQRLCGSTCVNLANDQSHCGTCGTVCGAGTLCSAGGCAPRCPAGMVYIPAGTFLMGDADTASAGAQPPHMVTLSSYCMDRTEVTESAYRSCTVAGCTAPGTTTYCNWGVGGRESHPINCVTWNQARAYCRSAVGRDLPTEAQWEYAARGTDGRTYPWGFNPAPTDQLCWNGVLSNRMTTCAVPYSSTRNGDSPFGISDMAGNVWEWTLDFYAPYASAAATDPRGPVSGSLGYVVRGGAWNEDNAASVRTAFRSHPLPKPYQGAAYGFRCARVPLL